MATQRKHQPRNRRKGGRLYHLYMIVSILLIVAAVVAGSVVFFKANQFEVTGNQRYTQEELLESADIAPGSNLLLIPRRDIAKRMEESLPYLKKVRIRLLPPEKVVIAVEETTPAGAVQVDGKIWYMDCSGKLLEQVSGNEGVPEVTGLTIVEPEVGQQFQVSEEESLKAKGLRGILTALEEKELLGRVQKVDISSASYLTIRYDDRLTVKMGLNDDFNYDLKMLAAAESSYINDNWSDNDTGTLDMTKRDGEAVLSKD